MSDIIFVIWRKRESLIGPSVQEKEGLTMLHRLSRPAWAAVIALAVVMTCCSCLGLWTVWFTVAADR